MYGLTISNYFLYQNSKVSFKSIVTILSTVYRVKRFTEKNQGGEVTNNFSQSILKYA